MAPVRQAVGGGFGQMREFHLGRSVQVGDRAGHPKDAVVRSRRKPESTRGAGQELDFRCGQGARVRQALARQRGVGGVALSRPSERHGRFHQSPQGPGVLGGFAGHQVLRRQRLDFQVDVQTVQQRTRQAGLVAFPGERRAGAGAGPVTVVPARTRIGRRQQLAAAWVADRVHGAAHHDFAVLQRLAQRFQHVAREFGELVQEQHAAVRKAHLAGPRVGAAVTC